MTDRSEAPAGPAWRRWALWLVRLAISIGLLWLVLRNVDAAAIWKTAQSIAPLWLAAAVALVLVQNLINAARWQIIVRQIGGGRLPLGQVLRIYYAALFVNLFMPGTVGGDALRIWKAYDAGLPLATATNSVLLERSLSILGLIVMIGAGLPALRPLVGDSAAGAFALVVGAGVFGIVALTALDRLPWTRLSPAVAHRLGAFAADLRLLLLRPWPCISALGLAIAAHVMTVAAIYALARGVGASLGALDALVVLPPVLLAVALPISVAGWGLREGAMVAAFASLGIAAETAVLTSLLVGLLNMALSLPGAAFVTVREKSGGRSIPP